MYVLEDETASKEHEMSVILDLIKTGEIDGDTMC